MGVLLALVDSTLHSDTDVGIRIQLNKVNRLETGTRSGFVFPKSELGSETDYIKRLC